MASQLTSSLHVSDLILQASPVVQAVMLLLVLASLYSWYLIAKLHMVFKHSERQDRRFQKKFWSDSSLKTLYQDARRHAPCEGVEEVFYQGIHEFLKQYQRPVSSMERIESTERILRVSLTREQSQLEHGLGTLASIGSVAPYVGLFGTVWGIMNAFIGLAQVEQVTLATVAPGIAEALIATAIGLFAAIPAVLAFNHYTAKSEAVYSARALFAEEIVTQIQHQTEDLTQDQL